MSTEPRTTPMYVHVDSESELESLIPGDRVRVALEAETSRWMVYAGRRNGSTIQFIDYTPELSAASQPNPDLPMWGSEVRYLQFPRAYVHFDSFHKDHAVVRPTDPDYAELKTLVDKLPLRA